MKQFFSCKPTEWAVNPFSAIGKRAMLIVATKPDGSYNMMTASWGTLGTLWGRDVCTVYIRPQRYTYGFSEVGTQISLCFFDDAHRHVIQLCGSKSGRDIDKTAACALTPRRSENGTVYFEEATDVILARKLYAQNLDEACFTEKAPLDFYEAKDFHRMYVCEIEDVLTKEGGCK